MMWTLELSGGQWKNEARFPVRDLWMFDGFKEAGLPEAKVGYPLLTADGALCLVVTGDWPVLWILLFRCFLGGSHLHI